jgi:5,10-methylenetetrahydromethanopterin reductase
VLGFEILTFTPIPFTEMVELARIAEDLGFDRVYTSESLTDALALDMAIACATTSITAASSVSVIHLRHPLITALAATTISDISGGRFILGLGVGHEERVRALGVTPGLPLADIRSYVSDVRRLTNGEIVYPDLPRQTYNGRDLAVRTPTDPLRIHIAAVGPKMTELAGEIADGFMLQLVPIGAIPERRALAEIGSARAGRSSSIEVSLIIHTLVDDDLDVARDRAREALTYWVGLPAYNNSIRGAGFEAEADALRAAFLRRDPAGIKAALSPALLDEFCLLGPPSRCLEQLDRIREGGVDVPILKPSPIHSSEGYREAVERTLRQLAPR